MEIREGIEMREISRFGGSGDDTDQPRYWDSVGRWECGSESAGLGYTCGVLRRGDREG